jgi:hypothetical protein
MSRSAGIVTLVITLVGSLLLFVTQWSGAGQRANDKTGANPNVARAETVALTATQTMADQALQAYKAGTGSFEGAQLAGVSGATLVSTDATNYCLRLSSNGVVAYEYGPGGTLTPTPCR